MSVELSALLGNEVAARVLRASLRSGRIAHAYLFRGPEGSPKEVMAFEFAAGLLCDNVGAEGTACRVCYSCREVFKRTHPDLYTVERDGTAIRIKKSHEILKEAMSRPFQSERKVFVVLDVDDMTVEASNALLKLIEEPPSYVTFILTTGNASAIPETIISRCQIVPFRRMPGDGVSGDSLEEIRLAGEDALKEVLSASPVEQAVRYAKSEPLERVSLVSRLRVAIQARINGRISLGADPSEELLADRELRRSYTALRAVMRASQRLDRNANGFLTLSILFIDLNRALSEDVTTRS